MVIKVPNLRINHLMMSSSISLPPDPMDLNMDNNNNNQNLSNNFTNTNTINIQGPHFAIATYNVRGLSTITKQSQLIAHMLDNEISILSISETKLRSQATSSIFKGNTEVSSWWGCNDTSPLSSGVGLILHHSVAKYVQSVKDYKGRVIHADLYLRGNTKLRIVQVYIQAHITDKASRRDIDNYIFKLIDQAQEKQFKIIIMGDFNSDPDVLEDLLDNGSKVHWRYNLLMRLKHHGFLDSYRCFHDSGVLHGLTNI